MMMRMPWRSLLGLSIVISEVQEFRNGQARKYCQARRFVMDPVVFAYLHMPLRCFSWLSNVTRQEEEYENFCTKR